MTDEPDADPANGFDRRLLPLVVVLLVGTLVLGWQRISAPDHRGCADEATKDALSIAIHDTWQREVRAIYDPAHAGAEPVYELSWGGTCKATVELAGSPPNERHSVRFFIHRNGYGEVMVTQLVPRSP